MTDIIFQKALQDMIKGIRSHKQQSSEFISQEITNIKLELKSSDPFIKTEAIRKLTYLQLIGYNISWAAFSIIEVMSFPRFAHKQIGYLAANQSFNESTDLILLTTNLYKKEFALANNSSQYEVGVALNSLSNIVTSELGRDCLSDIVGLINHNSPYLRKKAVLALYKLYIKYPAGLRLTFDLIKERLEDSDGSVVSTAVSVICELANRNPKNYLGLAPTFFNLLQKSNNNWLLIKLSKLFEKLVSEEPRLARKLIDPLVTLIQSNSAKSLQFECIQTLTTAFLYTKKEDGTDAKNVPNAVKVCSDTLQQFIVDQDQNLKYLGLVGFINLMKSHPRVVVEQGKIILSCLEDDDSTIRTKALELLAGIVSKKSLIDIVKHLLSHVSSTEGVYRDQVISTILFICSKDKYALLTDFPWYVSVLVKLAMLDGSTEQAAVCTQLVEVCLRVSDVRAYAVDSLLPFLLDPDMILARPLHSSQHIYRVSAWVVGEYSPCLVSLTGENAVEGSGDDGYFWMDGPEGEDVPSRFHRQDLHEQVLDCLLSARTLLLPYSVQTVFLHAASKILIRTCQDCSETTVAKLLALVRARIQPFLHSFDLEVMERASCLRNLLSSLLILPSVDVKLSQTSADERDAVTPADSMGAQRALAVKHLLGALVNEPFYVVSSKAQRRVPAPSGVDLNRVIDPDSVADFFRSVDVDTTAALSPQSLILFTDHRVASKPVESTRGHYGDSTAAQASLSADRERESFSSAAASASYKPGGGEKADNLFYLRSSTSTADAHPLSKVLMDAFDDPGSRSAAGKRSKKAKRAEKKGKAPSVSVVEMLPAGAVSSDDEDQAAGKRRTHNKKKAPLHPDELSSVDITSPLRPDEVIPVQKHRDTVSHGSAPQDYPSDPGAAASGGKKSRKEHKPKRKGKSSDTHTLNEDLLDLTQGDSVRDSRLNESLPKESKSKSSHHKPRSAVMAQGFAGMSPAVLSQPEFFEAVQKTSKRWITSQITKNLSKKPKHAAKTLAALFNSHLIEMSDVKFLLSAKTPSKDFVYCVCEYNRERNEMIIDVKTICSTKDLSVQLMNDTVNALASVSL